MATWVLVILMYDPTGHAVAMTNIQGFNSLESCVRQVDFVRTRSKTADAYCIEVK